APTTFCTVPKNYSQGRELQKALITPYMAFDMACLINEKLPASFLNASLRLMTVGSEVLSNSLHQGSRYLSTALAIGMVANAFQTTKLNAKPYPYQSKRFMMAA
ncbi:hypothetical protein HDU76_011719, partial [Blyttiomyces sp. JEL0837]